MASCISSSKIKLTGCDHPSKWCNEIRNIANKSWKYSQLCKNVYCQPFTFDLNDHYEKIQDFENKQIDFFSSLYKDKQNNEYVLVFRGTDSFEDFKTGNNPFKAEQNEYALKIFDDAKNQYNFDKCIVTGHSLGGGIAMHISLNRENVTAYSFNGSPVFINNNNFSNERFSIVENGEILKIVRLFGREADQLYTSIGCSKGDPITQHDMKNLAICLTKIAAVETHDAKKSLELNSIN